METTQSATLKNLRIILSAVIALLIFSLLLWDYFHGGVPSHHIFDQKDLPAISNWWSGILLPVLAWILLGRIKTRLEGKTQTENQQQSELKSVLGLFSIGLLFGMVLSVSFIADYKPFLDNVLYLLLILSFFLPIFYSEFILGFVLSMTYTFGAILPTAFILVLATVGFLLYRFLRPFLLRLTTKKDLK